MTEAQSIGTKEAPSWRFLAGVFTISAGFITLELLLTKLFALMVWYHLSFVAISLAMLGFASSGVYLMLRPVPPEDRTTRIPRVAFQFAISALVLLAYSCAAPFLLEFLKNIIGKGASRVIVVTTLFGLSVVPFFLAGLFLSWALVTHAKEWAGRVYGSNLVGSAAGCWIVILLLKFLGCAGSIVTTAIAGFGATLLVDTDGKQRKKALVGLLACSLLLIPALLRQGDDFLFLRTLIKLTFPTERHELRRWDSSSCVDFVQMPPDPFGFWGADKRDFKGAWPRKIGVYIDSYAFTSIINAEDLKKDSSFFDRLPISVPLSVKERKSPHVLVIGAGGGNDVRAALHFGANKVTAVEINPLIVQEVRGKFKDYSGDLYNNPKVHAVVAEGRNFARRSGEKYDAIIFSGVDTVTGSQAGAFSFAENFLYTKEALRDFYQRLKPGGYLYYMRFVFDQPREMMRLCAVARSVLEDEGVKDVKKCVFGFDTKDWIYGGLIVKKGEIEEQEERNLQLATKRLGYDVIFTPSAPGRKEYDTILTHKNVDEYIRNYTFCVHPVTDDSPFFFFYARWSRLFDKDYGEMPVYWEGPRMLVIGLVAVLWLFLFFSLIPARHLRSQGVELEGHYPILGYFACLGLAYLFVEIALMNKLILLLGHPFFALAVILAVMLVASGAGSVVSERFMPLTKKGLIQIFGLLLVAQIGLLFGIDLICAHWLTASMFTRILVSVAVIFPVAFLMGFPFPLGMSVVGKWPEQAVAWAWSFNGYFSVLSSATSIFLAIELGFRGVFTAGILAYLFGLCFMWIALGREERASAS